MSEGADVIWANQKFEPRVVNLANDNLPHNREREHRTDLPKVPSGTPRGVC